MKKDRIKRLFIGATQDTFLIALCAYIVYFAADLIKPGFATNYLNMNWLLLVVILLGMLTVLMTAENTDD